MLQFLIIKSEIHYAIHHRYTPYAIYQTVLLHDQVIFKSCDRLLVADKVPRNEYESVYLLSSTSLVGKYLNLFNKF